MLAALLSELLFPSASVITDKVFKLSLSFNLLASGCSRPHLYFLKLLDGNHGVLLELGHLLARRQALQSRQVVIRILFMNNVGRQRWVD